MRVSLAKQGPMHEYHSDKDILPRALRSIARIFIAIAGFAVLFLFQETDAVFTHAMVFPVDDALSSPAGHIIVVSLGSALLWHAAAYVVERRRIQSAQELQRRMRGGGGDGRAD